MADTSVYIQHPEKIEEIDFASLVGARTVPIHVLVPIIVVDELDGLKRSCSWCAGYTLAVFDQLFATSTAGPAQLRAADSSALDTGGRLRENWLSSWCSTHPDTFDSPSSMTMKSSTER